MKKKALILFKAQWDWNKFIISKISNFYEVKFLYLDQIKKNYLNTISQLNNFIIDNKIDTVFFDVDYQKFVNYYFINKIKNVKIVMMSLDNYERHNLNIITACSCHVVLTDPISLLKYKELGIPAYNWLIESDGSLYKDMALEKKTDVLFFGKVNKDRKNFFEFIENNGIKVKVVGNNVENYVSDRELVNLICESKIVINFSKTTWNQISNYPEKSIFKNQYQLKGRIIQSGLCGTACITEYAPQNKLLYKDDELLQFTTKEECVEILKELLKNNNKLLNYAKKFSTKTREEYEDKKFFKKIYYFLEKVDPKIIKTDKNLRIIPYWYKRICCKQIMLRDLKISNFFKSIYNFKEIFNIAKKSNIFTFLLISIETCANFIYYSLLNSIKRKTVGKNRYTDEL